MTLKNSVNILEKKKSLFFRNKYNVPSKGIITKLPDVFVAKQYS